MAASEAEGQGFEPQDAELKIELTERAATEDEKAAVRVKIQEITALLEDNKIDAFGAYVNLGALHTQLNQINDAIKNMVLATNAENTPPEEEYKPWLNLSQLYILVNNYRAADEALSKTLNC